MGYYGGYGYGRGIVGLIYLVGLLIFGVYYLITTFEIVRIILIIVGFLLFIYILTKFFTEKENTSFSYNSSTNTSNNYYLKKPRIDKNGYERDFFGYLVHRNVAYNEIYKEGYQDGVFTKRFREYEVHHIDGDKRNNSVENLQVLTREQHKKVHNIL